jgi:hypothetical protein
VKTGFLGAIIIVFCLGCERDTQLLSVETTTGYKVQGRVSDRIGNPVAGVSVSVWYDYELVDRNPAPSKDFTITDSTKTLSVVVRNRSGQTIRTIFTGTLPPGNYTYDWDMKDATGNDPPASMYAVHYLVDGVSQKSYSVTVSGTIVALTDVQGQYTIPDNNLPVGFYPVPIYSFDKSVYFGNHRIVPAVRLAFTTTALAKEVVVNLSKDVVKKFDVTLD